MSIPRKPRVDDWYKDAEDGRSFRIVAVDEDGGTVEVQYFDGDIEEFDTDTWYQMDLTRVAEPEDWSGPFDDLEEDDKGETYRAMRPEDWNGPADEMDYEE
jgi:hypothetical protein